MTLKRNKEFFDKFLHDCKDHETKDVIEFNMGYIPYLIERIEDGEILYLNEDNVTYSFKPIKGYDSEDTQRCGWTWGRLFKDSRCEEAFRPLGWVKIDNLDSVHKALRNKKR